MLAAGSSRIYRFKNSQLGTSGGIRRPYGLGVWLAVAQSFATDGERRAPPRYVARRDAQRFSARDFWNSQAGRALDSRDPNAGPGAARLPLPHASAGASSAPRVRWRTRREDIAPVAAANSGGDPEGAWAGNCAAR